MSKKTIYFTLDESGHLDGYSSTPLWKPGEIVLEVEENHEVLRNPFVYRFVNGELVKDSDKHLQIVKEVKMQELSEACQKEIYGYFDVQIGSTTYSFSFDQEAQANFNSTMLLFMQGIISEIDWTAHKGDITERITLNKETFEQIYRIGFQRKNELINRLRKELQPMVENAQTIEEVQQIMWRDSDESN